MAYLSFAISALALMLSGTVAWLTLFRRGTLKITRPAFIAFRYDVDKDNQSLPKIFVRALLYSTGKRGHVVENMYLIVRFGKERRTFNVWGHGDEKLSRGSGLFIGETGVAANHHFNPVSDSPAFEFLPGEYEVSVFATLPGRQKPLHLHTVTLEFEEPMRVTRQNADASIWFDWQPEANRYHAHSEVRRRTIP
ncbi:MAG: hypothetical protein HY299_02645 [Verrucomicrobia bacterium]|nr:hypothetical protein [Verrucomicrobiota bacterium]